MKNPPERIQHEHYDYKMDYLISLSKHSAAVKICITS